jgi:hypothetical protein
LFRIAGTELQSDMEPRIQLWPLRFSEQAQRVETGQPPTDQNKAAMGEQLPNSVTAAPGNPPWVDFVVKVGWLGWMPVSGSTEDARL